VYILQVSTGGAYPGTSVTSVLTSAVEAYYIRLEILLPAATSAAAMAALKVEFYGSVTSFPPVVDNRMKLCHFFDNFTLLQDVNRCFRGYRLFQQVLQVQYNNGRPSYVTENDHYMYNFIVFFRSQLSSPSLNRVFLDCHTT